MGEVFRLNFRGGTVMLDYDKQLDLEIMFMEMFEKCPDGNLAEVLLEDIQNVAECALEQIKEEKGWE